MFKQMDIFDFIERPQEPEDSECKSMFERLFEIINNPVIQCANCLCEHCANNAEEVWRKVSPEEQREACFNCDECWHYTGSSAHRTQRKENCAEFIISDYAAKLRRKKIKKIKFEEEE